MRKAILAIMALLAIPTLVFAATITPTTATWDASTGGALEFTLEEVNDVTALKFVKGSMRVEFVGQAGEYTYDKNTGKLIIYELPLTKTPNNTYTMIINDDENLPSATVTVKGNPEKQEITPTTATFDIANPTELNFALKNVDKVEKLVFVIDDKTKDEWSEGFVYKDGTLTVDKDALTIYAKTLEKLGTYTMKVNGEDNLAVSVTFKDTTEPEPTPSSSGGGGCNAGFGALALLSAMPLIFKKRK